MHEFTPLEQRIQIRTDFYHAAQTFHNTDGVMHEIALERCNRYLDEYLDLQMMERSVQLDTPVEPGNDFPPT